MNYNYNPYQNYGMYQPNYQNQQQYIPTTNNSPINDIKFVTADEARAYIVMPNTKVMLMDRDKSVFYIKSADSLGKSTLEEYKYTRLDNSPNDSVSPALDPSNFVKTQELDSFKDFIIKEVDTKLDKLHKQIVGDMLKGDNHGKQST